MLEIRSCCEHCNTGLSAESKEARVCSFECTFCVDCVENVLDNICPNCGGDFQLRPIRPAIQLKGNNFLGAFPAAQQSLHRPVDLESHKKLVAKVHQYLKESSK